MRPGRKTTLRTKTMRSLIVLAAMAAQFHESNGALAAGQAASDPVYWGRHDLAIPYRWTGNAGGSQVVLYYSADQGRTWPKAASALPHVRSFRFQAPGDGEYWFTTRSYDSLGRATPATPLAPEMRVIVDTVIPRIDSLRATLAIGVLTVDLTASDTAGLSNEATHLYAQVEGQAGWLPVPVVSASPSADKRLLQLTARWRSPATARRVSVRATIEDLAGNRAEATTISETPQNASIASRQIGNAPRSAVPSRSVAWGTSTGSNAPVDPFAAAERSSPLAPQFRTSQPLADPPFADPDRSLAASRRPASARRHAEPPSTPWPADRQTTRPLFAATKPASDAPFSSASFRALPSDPFGSNDARDSMRPSPTSPPGRLVNSTEFEFDYELDQTGRWGVAKVELWGTENNGRSWRRFAIDSDRQSPIHVSAPGEGEYGFRLVVESIGGLEATTPRPGDTPEATVGVDLTLPRVALTGARQGVGYFADQLIIEWSADDAHFGEKPIDLYYSNRATGPWIPVATNLANSGRHSWRLQRHLPRQMHLRIEARDEAGNVGSATTPEALAIDVATASGSLRGVRPSGG